MTDAERCWMIEMMARQAVRMREAGIWPTMFYSSPIYFMVVLVGVAEGVQSELLVSTETPRYTRSRALERR